MKSLIQLLLALALSGANAWADSTKLPENLIAHERPTFPAELKATSTLDGYATVAFTVRADGLIDDAVVLEASHVAFGESVLEVLPTWRFMPEASADMWPRRDVLRFEFAEKGVVTPMTHRDATKAAFPPTLQQRTPIRTVPWKDLQTPPERLSGSPFKASGGGSVAVSYIIDTSGSVRVPYVVNATRPELGLAALAAVKQWKFAPPMHEGMPVLVEDMRSFTVGKN